jgi:hypothetical protein
MDRLSDIPPTSTTKTPEEVQIMNQFFPPGRPPQAPPQQAVQPSQENRKVKEDEEVEEDAPPSKTSKVNWKLIGVACVAFLILANPWVEPLFCKIPYCGTNSSTVLAFKLVLFAIILVVASMFM